MDDGSTEQSQMTLGLDLGDKYSHICALDTKSGELLEEGRLRTTPRLSVAASATKRRAQGRRRGRNPLAVGEPSVGRVRSRGPGGQSSQDEADLR